MTKITSFDLTPFYRNTVGLDSLFDRITNQIDHAAQTTNYPPYNIIKTGEETYQIQLAVAGFGQGDIDVSLHNGQLAVTGNKLANDEGVNYLHHGISARKFVRTFQLADYIEVNSAVVKDGILTVNLERLVPEEAKPKTIAITYAN
jgi:molecular chaperone IbpA